MIAPEHHLYTVDALKRLLPGWRRSGKNYIAHCPVPAHGDQTASFSFREGEKGLVVKCFAGCTWDEIRSALDQLQGGALPRKEIHMPAAPQAPRTKIRTHVYHNADGTLFGTKTKWSAAPIYTWVKADGTTGLDGAKAPLYHVDKIQGKRFVLVAEGERDVESLEAIGLRATCNPNGAAEKIEPRHVEQLQGAGVQKVAVLYDNDVPGIKHGHDWAQACQQAEINTRLVSLPVLEENDGRDVTDYLGVGGTKDTLLELVRTASTYEPSADEPKLGDPGEKPTIITSDQDDMDDLHTEAFELVVTLNRAHPRVFQRGMDLARVRPDDDGRPVIESFSEDAFKGYLARAIRWQAVVKRSLKAIHPPAAVVKNILSRPEWAGIHLIRSVAQTPVFLANGTLVTTPGYHPSAQLWYDPAPGFTVTVPAKPTTAEIAHARDLLLELLVDFPFDGEASRAHALAGILLPYCREMIDGPTPLHLFDAPIQGAGKGLLIEVGAIMSTGRAVEMVSVPEKDENELRKRITSQFLAASMYIIIDNIVHPLRSASVAAALIAEYWGDRILGASKVPNGLQNRAVWMATGNNVELARDIARRTIVCRLEPVQEDPYLRKASEFTHPNLKAWVKEHRGELVSAALTLIRAWIVAGKPKVEHPPIGSFEEWADVMAGILGHAGVKGFLESFKETADATDPETEEWRAFVLAWWDRSGPEPVTAGVLVDLARLGIVQAGEHDVMALGHALAKKKGRVIAGYRIKKGQRGREGQKYQLEPVSDVSNTSRPMGSPEDFHGKERSSGKPIGVQVLDTSNTNHEEASEESRADRLNREWQERPRGQKVSLLTGLPLDPVPKTDTPNVEIF